MRVVVALGGNALLKRGEPLEAALQRRNVAIAADALAEMAAGHDLVVTHGNGPQVGLLALQSLAYRKVAPYPLDVLGAESEGMIGYLIEQELRARLAGRQVATLLTQIEVDPADPAFRNPTKPIGPVYQQAEADRLTAAFRWTMRAERGGLRRVVPSPEPRRIVELATIRLLADAHVLVICAGGGGIPVVSDAGGRLHGVPAVIDKDLASALLAQELGADALLLLTDVAAVYEGWEGASPQAIRAVAPEPLRRMEFAAGSMGPKVEAACRFVERTGGFAAIGALADGAAMLAGDAGTRIQAGIGAIAYWDA